MAQVQVKEVVHEALGQARELSGTFVLVFGTALAGLLGLVWLAVSVEVPIAQFTRDPAAVMNGPFYAGALSNVGVLLWCAAAAVCFFGASLLSARIQSGLAAPAGDGPRFLLASALFTCLLLVDDLFMLHDLVLPEYLQLRERYVILTYGLLMLAYLLRFRRQILQTDWLVLVVAGGFFSCSIVVDKLPETLLPMHHVFEDGAKFLGILGWLLYLGRSTRQLLTEPADVR